MRTRLLITALLVSISAISNLKSEVLSLTDITFNILGNDTSSEFLSVRWGTWNGSNFEQLITNSNNSGFIDASSSELESFFTQTNNSTYAPGTQFAIAIFTNGDVDSSGLNWADGATYATILTDVSWTAPTFSVSPSTIEYNFTSNTQALLGNYSFNAGNEMITLTAIPEPATYAAVASAAILGLAVVRRRKVRSV